MKAFAIVVVCVAVASAYKVSLSELPHPLTDGLNAPSMVDHTEIDHLLQHRYLIALPTQNIYQAEITLRAISDPKSPRYGERLTLDEIRKLTAAPLSMRRAVINYLIANKFTHIQDWHDSISFVSPSESHSMTYLCKQGINYDENTQRVLHPKLEELGVLFVEGKGMAIPAKSAELKASHSPKRARDGKAIGLKSAISKGVVGRQSMEYLYNITNNTISPANDHSSSVCACEYQNDQGFSHKGLDLAQTKNGFTSNPINKSHVVGSDNGIDDESQLDVQMMASISGPQELWFWNVPGWLTQMAEEVLAHDTPPWVLSNSWGWAAQEQCQITTCGAGGDKAYVNRTNAAYVKLGLARITFLAAAGDAGAPGRTNEQCEASLGVRPIFPGSSPWVVSVGGTYDSTTEGTVDLNAVTAITPLCNHDPQNTYGCANGTSEGITNYAETFLPIQWTAGGGFSIAIESPNNTAPWWQQQQVASYLACGVAMPTTGFDKNGRAYPDVSAMSNQCAVFDNDGTLDPGAGTSCATPIVATILSLANWDLVTRGMPTLGFANPALYQIAEKMPNAYRKPQPKNNHCTEYQCCPVNAKTKVSQGYYSNPTGGFDAVSGLGAPNTKVIRAELINMMANRGKPTPKAMPAKK